MPISPNRPCTKARCTKYATKKGRCNEHQIKAWDHGGKTRHERGYDNNWYKLRKQALTRDEHLCQTCLSDGVYTMAKEVDHIKPKYLGGDDSLDNLSSICHTCHLIKTKRESLDARSKVD